MRILFDQNVPRALRNLLPGHAARTAAEMGAEEKNAVSHRAHALRQLVEHARDYLSDSLR